MKPETTDAIQVLQKELRRVTIERNALARHIESLVAPLSEKEIDAAYFEFDAHEQSMRVALERVIGDRQKAGQFKALS